MMEQFVAPLDEGGAGRGGLRVDQALSLHWRQSRLQRTVEVFQDLYPGDGAPVERLVRDVMDLYDGRWPGYQACQVGYHTLAHVLEVALAAVRMVAGWNKTNPHLALDSSQFLLVLACALFHDSGYLKDGDDPGGTGAQHVFTHVRRSRELALDYLRRAGWSQGALTLADRIIDQTEFNQPVALKGVLADHPGRTMASIVATADLVAQMADPYYVERLGDLYAEFEEAYRHEGLEALEGRGVKVFRSVEELKEGTLGFFEGYVVPRLDALGRVYLYLGDFFGNSRNPYLESIATNLYGNAALHLTPRQRIGELLVDLGLVSEGVLNRALNDQTRRGEPRERSDPEGVINRLVGWIDRQSGRHYLGELLVEMGALSSPDLNRVVMSQILPPNLEEELRPGDLSGLLRLGVLLGSVRHVPHVFKQVLELLAAMVDAEAASILLADHGEGALVIVKAVGPQAAQVEGQSIPCDKGVAGWVFTQRRPAAVNHVGYDSRFFANLDQRSGFSTRAILAVPLEVDDHVMGVLEVLNKRGGGGVFDQRDLVVLHVVARQLAGSLDTLQWMMEHAPPPETRAEG